MKQWYVLKTKFAQEKKAEAHLSNQRVESWLPLYHDRRLSGGRVSDPRVLGGKPPVRASATQSEGWSL